MTGKPEVKDYRPLPVLHKASALIFGGSDGHAASCVTGRHLSSSVNSLLADPREFSSECPQRFHSVFARVEATIEALSGEARRTSVARYLLSS